MFDGASIARILFRKKKLFRKKAVGAGFLVSPKNVLTCTHVVNSALGLSVESDPSNQEVCLDFPSVPTNTLRSRVVSVQPCVVNPVNSEEFVEDIALLELLDPLPSLIKPIKLAELNDSSDLLNHSFHIMGFPNRKPRGAWVSGKIGRATANWIQIEVNKVTSYKILHGFSGAPVFDEVLNSVVGMVVSAEIEQQATKVAFMIPSYLLVNSSHRLERETLEKVLEKVIVIEEIASAIANYKKDFLEDTKVGIRQEIISMNKLDVFTLHLMTNQGSIYKKVEMSTPAEYGKVLLEFVNSKNKSYKGKSIRAGIITVTLEVLQRVILDFYTSWKIKEAIKKTLANISQEKIKQTVESISPYQGDSNEVALRIYKLLKDYELVGASGKVVDDAFARSIKEILAQSGMYTGLSLVITAIVHTFFTSFLHVTVGGIFPWLIPAAIAVLAYQAFTFQETLAKKVSADVADKVSLEFGKFNREISNNVKLQIIKNICSVM